MDRLVGLANDVGLLSEEYDVDRRPDGRQLPAGLLAPRAGGCRDEHRAGRPSLIHARATGLGGLVRQKRFTGHMSPSARSRYMLVPLAGDGRQTSSTHGGKPMRHRSERSAASKVVGGVTDRLIKLTDLLAGRAGDRAQHQSPSRGSRPSSCPRTTASRPSRRRPSRSRPRSRPVEVEEVDEVPRPSEAAEAQELAPQVSPVPARASSRHAPSGGPATRPRIVRRRHAAASPSAGTSALGPALRRDPRLATSSSPWSSASAWSSPSGPCSSRARRRSSACAARCSPCATAAAASASTWPTGSSPSTSSASRAAHSGRCSCTAPTTPLWSSAAGMSTPSPWTRSSATTGPWPTSGYSDRQVRFSR